MNNSEAHSVKSSFTLRAFAAKHSLILAGASFVLGALVAIAIWCLLPLGQAIDHSRYQAVYLINGQMYFGKLQNTGGTYLYMKSPYTPDTTKSSQQTADSSSASNALVRVKNQLWGPDDSIAIRADQVAFWQNLRDDSKVSEAIKAKE